MGTTICYEGVFPEISRKLTQQGANLLINLTNDAWYGISSAPWKLFQYCFLAHLISFSITLYWIAIPIVVFSSLPIAMGLFSVFFCLPFFHFTTLVSKYIDGVILNDNSLATEP